MSGQTIAIIGGCGHVGLPLGLALARSGARVIAVDHDADKVAATTSGKMPFRDRGTDSLLPEMLSSGRFSCTTDDRAICDAQVVITSVGTPVDEHLNPRIHTIFASLRDVLRHFRDGQLLVLRSTVTPGTTDGVRKLFEREGPAIDVAFCPERVAQGFALEEIQSLPQIVAGCTPQAQSRAEALFANITKKTIPLTPVAAELAKLYTNAWRYIQFAVSNEFFTMANDYDVDFYDVHRAMTEDYPRASGFPGAGFAAGPCLFKDTMQLGAFHSNRFFLGHAAMLVNEGLPNYLVERARARFDLDEMTVGIVGMAFKGDSDDPRESLSYKLKRILEGRCRQVLCSDPFVEDETLVPQAELVDKSELIFIGAPHSDYRELDVGETPLIDPWNIHPRRLVNI